MGRSRIEMPNGMTDAETVVHFRQYVKETHGLFSWPTDACGYDQDVRFTEWRNTRWTDELAGEMTFDEFILDYADRLERGEVK